MSRNTISRITSRIDDLTERLGPRRITIVGADEAECHKQLTEIEAANSLAGRDFQFITTGVPRSAEGIASSSPAMEL
ncbi:MAG: hypothetical protein AB7L36_10360 [Sphingomonadaceae bacterium]